jgi:hypothetical protein
MPLRSNTERVATVEVARSSEPLVGPFQRRGRLMTLLVVWQLGLPVATLHRRHHRGESLTGHRIGRHVRYWRAAVEAWIETQAISGPPGRAGSMTGQASRTRDWSPKTQSLSQHTASCAKISASRSSDPMSQS